jgi:hypothetical protein
MFHVMILINDAIRLQNRLISSPHTVTIVGYQLQRHGDLMNVTTGHCRVIIKTRHLKSSTLIRN